MRIAKLILADRTHADIVRSLHCSFTTVAKVSVWLSQGGEGFRAIIAKLPARYEFPKKLPPVPLEFQLPRVISTFYKYVRAGHQSKQLDNFFEGVRQKESIDKELRESFSEHFRSTRKLKRL